MNNIDKVIHKRACQYFDICSKYIKKYGFIAVDDAFHDCIYLFQGFLDGLCAAGLISNENRDSIFEEYYSFFGKLKEVLDD